MDKSGEVAEMFMANEPLKLQQAPRPGMEIGVAEMFMANEPLKHIVDSLKMASATVAEMFMANEPLKPWHPLLL